jgi:hypothetical protein
MPTLQITLTKRDIDPWILTTNVAPSLEYFTQDEIDNILVAHMNAVRNIPGLINISETTEGNTKVVSYVFDSMEHAKDSKYIMVDSELAKAREELLKRVMLKHSIEPYFIQTTTIL